MAREAQLQAIEEQTVLAQRAIRGMVGAGLLLFGAGVTLVSTLASPFARVAGLVLIVWGIGVVPAVLRARRQRVEPPTPGWK